MCALRPDASLDSQEEMPRPSFIARIAGIELLIERFDRRFDAIERRLDTQDEVNAKTLEQGELTNGRVTVLEKINEHEDGERVVLNRKGERAFTLKQIGLTLGGTWLVYELLNAGHPLIHLFH